MKIKILISLIMLFPLFTGQLNAQEKDSLGNYNVKKMSREDILRVFGPIEGKKINKVAGDSREIKSITIGGNKITSILYNYGSICSPSALANSQDLVWNGLGYGFEFGTLAGGEVEDTDGNIFHIISDSHVLYTQGDYSSDRALKWGWLPKSGYSDPTQNDVASLNAADNDSDGKPDSWPEEWYSEGAGKYLWPAFLGDMATSPDEEVYYAIDDYSNYEFINKYQPFNNDLTKGGLGLDAFVRVLQFNNPLAEDLIFMIYQITNASDKDLSKVFFGMYGDPHVGGSDDYNDDMSFFIPPTGEIAQSYKQRERSMVYSYDKDYSGHGGKKPGYFGWKFLESPSIADDVIDNDDDGVNDETPFNDKGVFIDGVSMPLNTGIAEVDKYTNTYGAPKARWSGDEDGDWRTDKDDTGIDGIGIESPNYPGADFGEGDGVPTQAWYSDANNNGIMDLQEESSLTETKLPGYKWAGSEPNFGYRDISESDQLGLTGFTVAVYGEAASLPKEDENIWGFFAKPEIDEDQPLLRGSGDNAFCFSTGPMALKKGESQRFSMAILMGENLQDLLLNAQTSVKILEADYRFAQPPDKPTVKAVAGDGKVTLYWDAKAESSLDAFSGEMDFEGYKIYRSQDYTFSDIYTITDGNGVPFLGSPLEDPQAGKTAQFDLDNTYSGFAAIEYEGRGVKYYLGNNTGLAHEYVDSTVTNGITYYYAVVAYDRGTNEIPPTETQSVIQKDPLTGQLLFDVNTAQVIPGPLSSGIIGAEAGLSGIPNHISGDGSGDVIIKVLEDEAVQDKLFKITFNDTVHYSVLDSTGVEFAFMSKDTVMYSLPNKNLVPESIALYDQNKNIVDTTRYYVNALTGQIRSKYKNGLPKGETFTVYYRYYPVYQSSLYNFEDGNPSFNGMRIYVQGDTLGMDNKRSNFESSEEVTVIGKISFPPVLGNPKVLLRADWEVRWNDTDTLDNGSWAHADSVRSGSRYIKYPFTIYNVTEDQPAVYTLYEPTRNYRWDWGELIILQPQNNPTAATYQFTFTIDKSKNPVVLPQEGDIYHIRTTKPFQDNDEYTFETKTIEYSSSMAQNSVNNIYVVPNPYVAYSGFERPGSTLSQKGDRELQFRNLPPKCTIRIYTITGELVDQIEKDDNTSIAAWDLLSSEGMRIAYGVYLYHVDIPDVGERIGRFAVIK